MVIEDLVVDGAVLKLSAGGMQGNTIDVPLPSLHLTDIGRSSQGATLGEVLSQVLGAILENAGKVVASSGELLGEAAGRTVDEVGKGASRALDRLKDLPLGRSTNP